MKLNNLTFLLLLLIILGSCSSSHDVVDGGLFQKRKYNKGFHFKGKKSFELKKGNSDNELLTLTNPETISNAKENVVKSNQEFVAAAETINSITVTQKNDESSPEISTTNSQTALNKIKSIPTRINSLPKAVNFFQPMNLSGSGSALSSADVSTLLLVIIALFIPFLAVGLYEGVTTRFWITLILTLIGWGVGGFIGGLGWLAALVAVILAILIVLGMF